MITIATYGQARKYMLDNESAHLREDIKRVRNVSDAEIDQNGDVHVGSPQNAWLNGDALIDLANRLDRGV